MANKENLTENIKSMWTAYYLGDISQVKAKYKSDIVKYNKRTVR